MHVSKMMRTDLTTVPPETRFETLLRMLACSPSRQIYVTGGDGRLIGLVTSYDLLKTMAPFYIDSNLARALPDDSSFLRHAFQANINKTAAEVMNSDVATLKPEDHFLEAEVLIRDRGCNVLPVVDEDGRLVGDVTRKVIVRHLAMNVLGLPCAGTEAEEEE